MSKQFIHGICRICGKDHKEVMKDNSIYMQYLGIQECISTTRLNNIEMSDAQVLTDMSLFKKWLKDHPFPEREDLKKNIAAVERCNHLFRKSIGYEFLITINFTEDYDLDLLKDNIEKLLKANYRYLKDGKFCVEFHGKKTNHWHIHVAIKSLLNRRKASIAKQLSKLMGVAQNYVDICQSYGDPEDYVAGIKTETKKEQLELDIELRNKLKLKHLYII